jgi:hypothetical protein
LPRFVRSAAATAEGDFKRRDLMIEHKTYPPTGNTPVENAWVVGAVSIFSALVLCAIYGSISYRVFGNSIIDVYSLVGMVTLFIIAVIFFPIAIGEIMLSVWSRVKRFKIG